jgi:uncharacterized protein DUF4439
LAEAGPTSTSGATATGTPSGGASSTRNPDSSQPSGTATPTAGASTASTTATLAAGEAGALSPESFASLAELDDDTVAVAAALLAQRGAAAVLLGETPSWPRDPWSEPALAARLLETTRSAVYGFEIVAAQSNRAQATLAKETLAVLKNRAAEQEAIAGARATPPALGYPLPLSVTTPAEAKRLAVHVMTGLREATAADLPAGAGASQPLAAMTRWLADTEVLASRWGIALEPFPGLQ